MIIRLKPDMSRHSITDSPGRASFILHERAPRFYGEGTDSLSIKSFYGGEALYDVGCGKYRVGENNYLILNRGQHYSINIDSETPVESFCIFFEDGMAEDVHYSLYTPSDKLLDNSEPPRISTIHFFEKTYPHDHRLSPALFNFKTGILHYKTDSLWIREQLGILVERMLAVHHGARLEISSLSAIRAATREELYRRLHRAKDFILASFEQPISVDEMARAACLSTNHFIRTFRQLFGQTPHQFLTAKRLEYSEKLLRQTELPVTEICLMSGFESLGSFSSLFRNKKGISPDKYRRQKR